jgi:hypothetical protein
MLKKQADSFAYKLLEPSILNCVLPEFSRRATSTEKPALVANVAKAIEIGCGSGWKQEEILSAERRVGQGWMRIACDYSALFSSLPE